MPQQPQQTAGVWTAVSDWVHRRHRRDSGWLDPAHVCRFAGNAEGPSTVAASAGPGLTVHQASRQYGQALDQGHRLLTAAVSSASCIASVARGSQRDFAVTPEGLGSSLGLP